MTGGSDDASPPDEESDSADPGWDAIVDGVERASSERTEHGDEPERGAPERSGSHRQISGSHAAVGKDRLAEPDQEMDRLMSGSHPIVPETRPQGAELSGAPARPSTGNGPSLTVLHGGGTDDVPTKTPKASRPVESPAAPEPASVSSSTSGGLPWAWLSLGAIAIAVVAYLGLNDDGGAETTPTKTTPPASSPSVPPPPEPAERPTPEPDPLSEPDDPSSDGSDGTGAGATPTQPPPGADPRVPPPSSSPEAIEAFTRLPVSPSDRPPVGGIGASGIHIDRIAIGSEVVGGECHGRRDDFSVSRRERATVCVRVVHQRQKEELQVLWHKHGGATRRSKMVVQPRHAYRTRGYLKLRKEYIGDWTVKILSSDDVELARHDFTVVP